MIKEDGVIQFYEIKVPKATVTSSVRALSDLSVRVRLTGLKRLQSRIREGKMDSGGAALAWKWYMIQYVKGSVGKCRLLVAYLVQPHE